MKADNTRYTFKKQNHYNSVRMQQGRVQLDADWNEQVDITAHRVETETIDIVGHCGAPMHHGGFHLVVNVNDLKSEEKALPENQNPLPLQSGTDFYISGGRIYVDGILCENEHIVPFTKQPDVPDDPIPADFPDLPEIHLPTKEGTYLAYLEVLSRHVTAIEDPLIREVALGGPDTATRTKIIWQVKLHRVGDWNMNANCLSVFDSWNDKIAPGDGKLAARAEEGDQSSKPCIIAAGAGYRRLENQLYRVEVHEGGNLGLATFKWSRDNGSIVTKWEKIDGDNITVSSAGRDKVLELAGGQWVELTDATHELLAEPGTLVQLVKVEGNILTIDPATATGPTDMASFPTNPKVRRWDSDAEIKPTNSNWIDLEDGVQVKFTAGSYKTGDYWLIPARTITADVEWPINDSTSQPELQLPHGIRHHYCRLALLHFKGNVLSVISDCRNIFPSVSELTSLFYTSGDGQEAKPGEQLAHPLQVGVANGKWPVEGANVKFEIENGNGSLSNTKVLTVNGIAQCDWTLGNVGKQRVKATLVDGLGKPVHLPVYFNASFIESGRGCSVTVGDGGQYARLDQAINALLEKGQRDICICMLPGDHTLPKGLKVVNKPNDPDLNLKIVGCSAGTSIKLSKTCELTGVTSFTLRDIEIDAGIVDQPFVFKQCKQLAIESCRLQNVTKENMLIRIEEGERIHLANNVIESFLNTSLDSPRKVFEIVGNGVPGLFKKFNIKDFDRETIEVSKKLTGISQGNRAQLAGRLRVSIRRLKISNAEKEAYSEFVNIISPGKVDETALIENIRRIRDLSIRLNPGTAIMIMDGNAETIIENNYIIGVISLYGNYGRSKLTDRELKPIKTFFASEISWTLLRPQGTLRLRNNRVTHLVSDDIIGRIVRYVNNEDTSALKGFNGIFKQSFIAENSVESGDNQFLSQQLFLNSNSFEIMGVVAETGAASTKVAGTAIGQSAIFMGNYASEPETVLYNISKESSNAANLNIQIVNV
jgi:hypothetical protein